MGDLLDIFDKKDIKDFQKDIEQIIRISTGVNKEFGKVNKNLDKYIKNYKTLIKLFNRKYNNLLLKIKTTLDEIKLFIFLRNEKNVRDVFINVASKIAGLKSIGTSGIEIGAEKFSDELENIKDKIYISYYSQDIGSTIIFMEYNKKQKNVELHYNLKDIIDEKNPEFKLIAYYALKDGFKKINIFSEAIKFGFLDLLTETEKKEWLEKFNPRFWE